MVSVTTIDTGVHNGHQWRARAPLYGRFWLLLATRIHQWLSWPLVGTVERGGDGVHASYITTVATLARLATGDYKSEDTRCHRGHYGRGCLLHTWVRGHWFSSITTGGN